MIGIRGSRDRVAKRYLVNAAAEALRAAGYAVHVDIDDMPRDRAIVLADEADRLAGVAQPAAADPGTAKRWRPTINAATAFGTA